MKIMVIDDHALCREALAKTLRSLGDDIEVCVAESAEAGLACTGRCGDVDLVLLDLKRLGPSWFDGLRAFRQRFPESPVVVITALEDPENVQRVLGHGAQGYIHKSSSPDTVLATLRQVLGGEVGIAAPWTLELPPPVPSSVLALTPRQREILVLLCDGLSNKEIARELAMSDNTVRVHLAAVFRTLGVATRTQAALLARQAGLA
jgi:DNA-binding NarL/FixJ family response regulator